MKDAIKGFEKVATIFWKRTNDYEKVQASAGDPGSSPG
jgi:hypothetical protein